MHNALLPPTRVNRPSCKLISTDLGSDPPCVACRVFHPRRGGRDGEPCTANSMPGSRYCWHHDPDHAEERRRNASRAATLGNSKIGAEIRSTRLLVRDIVELTISGDLDPLIRNRLTEIAQLLQTYCRLAELEIAAGERPRVGDVALPEDIPDRVKEWAEGEAEMEKQREEFMGKLRNIGKDPRAGLEEMGS